MKPPIPTKPTVESDVPPRRAALMPMAVALTFVLLFAAYLGYQRLTEPPPPPAPPATTNPQMLFSDLDPGWYRGPMNPRGILDSLDAEAYMGSASGLLSLQPGDEPLETEPADLAPFPRDELVKVQRLSGLRRTSPGTVEEIAVWELDGVDPGDAMSHYESEAARVGFHILRGTGRRGRMPGLPATPPTTQAAGGENRVFARVDRHDAAKPAGMARHQLLIVRSSTTPNGCRIVLWLRYPMQTPPPR